MESLEKNNPVNIIKRGFAVVYDMEKRVNINSIKQVSAGENIGVKLKDGHIRARVLEILKKKILRSGINYEDR